MPPLVKSHLYFNDEVQQLLNFQRAHRLCVSYTFYMNMLIHMNMC